MTAVLEAVAVGMAAGVVAGMLGVGGGVLFVPGLVFVVGLGQVEAEATSLLAIIPVSIVGAWRQDGYGNVRRRDAAVLGALASGGAVLGVVLANALPVRVIEVGFAMLSLWVAWTLARRSLAGLRAAAPGPDAGDR